MDNLFSDDPQFRRVQYKKLSDNTREWQQEISAMVSEKLPKDLNVDVTVVFQDIDDEKGYGIGTAVAKDTSGNGTQIGVPIIVKAWHLAPLDLFFSEGVLYPLSDDNLAKIFYQNSLGTGLAPSAPTPTMTDDSFAEMRNPPLGGKYSYSAPFSTLSVISGTLGAEDLASFAKTALESPALLGSFAKRGTFDLLCKYAAEKPATTVQDDINKERAEATFTIKKDGPDAYRLYSSTDQVYDPVLIRTNRQGLRNFLLMRTAELSDYEKDPLSIVDQYGTFTVEAPPTVYGLPLAGPPSQLGPMRNPFVFNPREDDRSVVNITTLGRYGVKDRDGVLAKGWVIPNVVNFDGSTADIKLFLGKALASMQNRISGILLDDDDDTDLEPESPDTGKIGTLIYRDGNDVLATVPFQIVGVTIFRNMRSLSVIDYKGARANLIISPTISGIVKITDGNQDSRIVPLLGTGANYIVSAKMTFIRMPRLCPISTDADNFKPLAAEWLDMNPVKVGHINGKYVFRSPRLQKFAGLMSRRVHAQGTTTFDKVAFDFNFLPRHEAEFLLCSWGLPLAKTAEVLDAARVHVGLEVHHLRMPDPPGPVKMAAPVTGARANILRAMKPKFPELLKAAADLEDAQTVDSVLSLGFVNPENVGRFAAAKPMLWETSHMLAKLLLASRLGMEDIPEEAVRSALSQLQRVLDGLGRLKLLEDQKVKTAGHRPRQVNAVGGRLVPATSSFGYAR